MSAAPTNADRASGATPSSELGRVLQEERRRTGTLQRMLSRRTGISQPNISAYERGRRQPSWPVFVKLLAAMDRRPVLETAPLEPEYRPPIDLARVIGTMVELIGDRPYRFEDETAAYLLGSDLPVSFVHVCVVADPDRLDEIALEIVRELRVEVTTKRGGSLVPQVQFSVDSAGIGLEVTAEERRSVQVTYCGRTVNVQPMDRIPYPWRG